MKKDINFNVSGGNLNIGNVVQGDNNAINAGEQEIKLEMDQAFKDFLKDVNRQSLTLSASQAQVRDLEREIESLKLALKAGEDEPTMIARFKEIAEKFKWAAPLLTKLLTKVAPGLAAVL